MYNIFLFPLLSPCLSKCLSCSLFPSLSRVHLFLYAAHITEVEIIDAFLTSFQTSVWLTNCWCRCLCFQWVRRCCCSWWLWHYDPGRHFCYVQCHFVYMYEHWRRLPSAFPVQFFILRSNIESPLPSQYSWPQERGCPRGKLLVLQSVMYIPWGKLLMLQSVCTSPG